MTESDSTKPLRWALLGTGHMSDVFVREIQRSSLASVVAVGSRTAERAAEFASQRGLDVATGTHMDMLRRPDVDVVFVCTTNESHVAWTLESVRAGKAVLVEKPIALGVRDLERVLSEARAHRVFCMEGVWMCFFPAIRQLLADVARLTPLYHIEANFGIDVPFDPRHRVYNPDLGGGALYDIGIYPLHFVRALWGLRSATFDADVRRGVTGVDEAARVRVRYSDGRTAGLSCSLREFSPHRATIRGLGGHVVLEDFFHPSEVRVHAIGAAPEIRRWEYPVMGYEYEIEEVRRCVQAGLLESPLLPLDASLEVLECLESLLRPAEG